MPLSASSLRTLASDLHNRLKGMSQAISETNCEKCDKVNLMASQCVSKVIARHY